MFGPRTLTRTTGQPSTETFVFTADPGVDYVIDITDFANTGANAEVLLNGEQVTKSSQVAGSAVYHLHGPILLALNDTLTVRLTGKPGSQLSIRILGGTKTIDVGGGTVLAPGGASVIIPSGALPGPVEIQVVPQQQPPPGFHSNRFVTAWALRPEQLGFALPVAFHLDTAALPLPPTGHTRGDILGWHSSVDGANAELLFPHLVPGSAGTPGSAAFMLDHFSVLGVLWSGSTGPNDSWATTGWKWAVPTVTWSLDPTTAFTYLGDASITAGLSKWAAVSGIRFQQAAAGTQANIVFREVGTIGFHSSWLSLLPYLGPCDLPVTGDLWGLTCLPKTKVSLADPVLFGQSDQVLINVASQSIKPADLIAQCVIVHEIGHAIGMAHTPEAYVQTLANLDQDAPVMISNPSVCPTALRPEDIAAAQFLYGLPAVPPAAPSNVVAAAASTTAVGIGWSDNSSDEDGFLIQRATTGTQDFSSVAQVGPNQTTYRVTGLSPATSYDFRVLAVRGMQQSSSSNVATAATFAIDVSRVARVVVQPPTATLAIGSQIQLTATAYDFAGNVIPGNLPWFWESSIPGAATVTQTGLVTGIAGQQGVSIIGGVIGGVGNVSTINVPNPSTLPARIGIEPQSTALPLGEVQQFVVTAYDSQNLPIPGWLTGCSWGTISPPGAPPTSLASVRGNPCVATTLGIGSVRIFASIPALGLNTPQATATLTISGSTPPATIALARSEALFSGVSGALPPQSQNVGFTNTGGGVLSQMSVSVSYPSGEPTGWLVGQQGDPFTPVINVIPVAGYSTLSPGVYHATVSVSSASPQGVTNSPQAIHVTVVVTP